ncbi:hypothetical protein Pres01_33300 [Metapseudomonas resinovorans]|nr:hypothetical protein Pres01_33300 [Pseudomonas resinovorans]
MISIFVFSGALQAGIEALVSIVGQPYESDKSVEELSKSQARTVENRHGESLETLN